MLGALAGVLLICDGVSHVQSRLGMLDIFGALFVVVAFGCLLVDRDWCGVGWPSRCREGWVDASEFGPAARVPLVAVRRRHSLGLACGVKWTASTTSSLSACCR